MVAEKENYEQEEENNVDSTLSPRGNILSSLEVQTGRRFEARNLPFSRRLAQVTGMTDYFEIKEIPNEVGLDVIRTAIQQYYYSEGFAFDRRDNGAIYFGKEKRQASVELTYRPAIGLLIVSAFDRNF